MITLASVSETNGYLWTSVLWPKNKYLNIVVIVSPSRQPPVDVYCHGRKDVYAPPRAPFYFAYNAESIAGFDLPFPAGDNETTTVHFTTVISHSVSISLDFPFSFCCGFPSNFDLVISS